MNYIIVKWFDYDDIVFIWTDEEAVEPFERAQIDQIYLAAKVVTADEVRADLGMPPLTDEQKAELSAVTASPVDPSPLESGTPAMPAIKAATSGVEKAEASPTNNYITVNVPEMKMPDVLVDIGSTTINAQFDALAPVVKTTQTVTATRGTDATILGKVVEG